MLRRNLFFMILVSVAMVCFSEGIIVAQAQSPPSCNEGICTIYLDALSFQPDNMTIRPPNLVTGESVKVIWVNNDAVTHTVTSGIRASLNPVFDSGNLAPGATFELTINQTIYDQLIAAYGSSVPYNCKIHAGMDATLNITGEPIPEYSLSALALTLALASIIILAMLVRFRKPIGSVLRNS
jgi:plastocyanin